MKVMTYRLNINKAIQAAGVLLREEPSRRMSYMRLLKLLYIADRESLKKTGRPITGDRVVAMCNGPVLSEVYDCIKGTACHLAEWERFYRTERYDVEMVDNPPTGELCRYEIETLQRVSKERLDKDQYEIVDETHSFPEWSDPGNTSRPIAFEDILKAVGWTDDQAKKILAEAAVDAGVDRLFERDP
jgi:uncharacterized phage-associated protein